MSASAKPAPAPQPKVARRVVGLFGPYRRRILVLALAVTMTSSLGTGAPVISKFVFDKALFPHGGHPRIDLLVVLVAAMVLLTLLAGVFAIVQIYLAGQIGQAVMHDLRSRLYSHMQTMSLRFFTTTRTGEIQSRITNDVGGVRSVVTQAFSTMLADFLLIVITLVAMTILSWQLTLVSVLVIPPFILASQRVGRRRRHIQGAVQSVMADMSARTEETLSISGVMLTKLFDRQRDAVETYGADSRRLAELRVRQQMTGRAFMAVAQGFFMVTPTLTYFAAGVALSNGGAGITAGTLVAFTVLQTKLFDPVREILQVSIDAQASMALFERIFEFLDMHQDLTDAPNARPLDESAVSGHLAMRQVRFRYETGQPALDVPKHRSWALEDVDLEIQPGQLAALVGPSGAGKTTLIYLLARLYDVTEGAVLLDGSDLRDIQLASLAQNIGIVTQEPYLFHSTVRENLLYARPGAGHDEVEAAARAAQIHERIMSLPEGYDTEVGERGYRMSGGEKQRLSIARTILKDPRILILDEATSSLDTTSERLVQKALGPLMHGRTTVAIAHRLSTIVAADVIFVLDRGRVVERGTHSELVALGGLYARLHHQQFGPAAAAGTAA